MLAFKAAFWHPAPSTAFLAPSSECKLCNEHNLFFDAMMSCLLLATVMDTPIPGLSRALRANNGAPSWLAPLKAEGMLKPLHVLLRDWL